MGETCQRSSANLVGTVRARALQILKGPVLSFGPLTVAVALLGVHAALSVVAKVGHPGASLDDAYIHFQYARAIAEGHPLQFENGEPITSGSTSLLWPALLAPFWGWGARGDAIMWPAWVLSFTALGGLAWEAFQLTRPLAGRVAAIGAGAMTVAFGGFVWCAASGMEVVPFAWAVARASRRASEWAEGEPRSESGPWRGRAAELVALAWIAALFRPEGAITALFVAGTLVVFARDRSWRRLLVCALAASAVVAVPLLLWALTGSPRSTTAVAKLLIGNPYYVGQALTGKVVEHARQLATDLLNGEVFSAEFLPHGGAPVAMAGLGSIAALGERTRLRWRAVSILLLALTIFAPCFYLTFLWNRLRYLWPFATGWIVGLACLARLVGDAAGTIRARWRVATGIACGTFVGLFASKLQGVIDDVAQSAGAIDRQQVALGRWARQSLPAGARIGVNDTGAIAYFSDRRTFDIVGLTTRDEAKYWVAGTASRLEHYERLLVTAPSQLPTHFIVYPEWMALDAVLGEPLHEASVTDAGRSILGGETMRAYVADWSKLGSGERPWSAFGKVVDAIDVADLESESDHTYELLGARDHEQIVREGPSPAGATVLDGGRAQRRAERFFAHLAPGIAVRGIVRLEGPVGTSVLVLVGHEPVSTVELTDSDEDWTEHMFEVPARLAKEKTPIELRVTAGGPLTVFHYWFVTGF